MEKTRLIGYYSAVIKLLLFPVAKKYRKLLISILLITALGLTLIVGLSSAYSSLVKSSDSFLDKYGKADLTFNTIMMDKKPISKIKNVQGVDEVVSRLVYDTFVKDKDGKYHSIKVFSFSDNDFIKFYTFEGMSMEEFPLVMLSNKFANFNGFKPGDSFEFTLLGKEYFFTVDSIVTNVDCINIQPYDSFFIDNQDLGYAFISSFMLKNTKLENKCNQILIKLKPEADPEKVRSEIEEILGEDNLNSSFSFEESHIRTKIRINSKSVKDLSQFCPLVFYLVVLMVISLFISLMVKQSRYEIAVLMAIGFTSGEIRKLFCVEIFIITAIAQILGLALSFPLSYAVSVPYSRFLTIYEWHYAMDFRFLALGFVSSFLVSLLSSLGATRQIVSVHPAEALARELPEYKPGKLLNKLKISPLGKIHCVSLFRSKFRLIFSILCFIAVSAMIFTSTSFITSKDEVIKDIFQNRIRYSQQVILHNQPSEEEILEIEQLNNTSVVEVVPMYSAQIHFEGQTIAARIDAITENHPSENLLLSDIPKQSIVLAEHVADILGAEVGDSVTLFNQDFTVSGTTKQCGNFIQYINSNQDIALREPDCWSLYCTTDNKEALINHLHQSDNFIMCLDTESLRRSGLKTYEMYEVGIFVFVCFALLIGIIIVANTIRSIIVDRRKDLSVLMAMGLSFKEISFSFLVVNLVLMLLSVLLGLPLAIQILKLFCIKVSTEYTWFPWVIKLENIVKTTGVCLIFTVIGHLVSFSQVKRWKLAEEIKEKD